jgi:hypothetical protein
MRLRSIGKKTAILATACVIVVVVVFFQFIVFKTPVLQPKNYSVAYYDEFDKTPTTLYNYSFSPPVSMYQALFIALESGGWTAESLKNMTLYVELDYDAFFENLSTPSGWITLGNGTFRTNPPVTGSARLYPVTQPPVDWSPQQIDNITYRYIWTIAVGGPGSLRSIPPAGYYYVDAATPELVPTGIL